MQIERRVLIAPSILSADFSRLGDQVREADQAGADAIHIDVMDGHFVPNITVGPLVVRAVRRVTELPLEVHLMIEEPERYIADFCEAGGDLVIVHVETCPHLDRTLHQIREEGVRVGVTLNPSTPVLALQEVLELVDQVLVMSVNPGFGGQSLIPYTLDKVQQLVAMRDERHLGFDIEVDGGINAKTARSVAKAGANILVIGSAIFGHVAGVEDAMRTIRQAL
ncbi:MAG: ribulose-phosphate 3-epimerase [Anaerolineae bacterium]|nr:ribulose-phosphate 3-epimerase [Anaerolineae bacterium]